MENNDENENNNEVDITELVTKACESMTYSNPLVCKETFNLYDSMSALDLMEPKMDGCQIPIHYYTHTHAYNQQPRTCATSTQEHKQPQQQEYVPPRPVPDSIANSSLLWEELLLTDSDPNSNSDTNNVKDHSPTRAVAVILIEMLVRLESLLAGNSVAESVYTCIYAHNSILQDMHHQLSKHHHSSTASSSSSTHILQHTLYLSTLLMVKLSRFIRSTVKTADIYEEEDFNVSTNDFDFFPAYGDDADSIQQLWNDVLHLKSMLQNYFLNDQTPLQLKERNQHNLVRYHVDIIIYVLECMVHLHQACQTLTTLSIDNVIANTTLLYQKIQQHHTSMQQFIQSKIEGNIHIEYTDQDKLIVFRTFDPYMNRKLFGNTPVRHITFSTPVHAFRNVSQIYHGLGFAVCKLLLKGDSLARIRRILAKLSNPSMITLETESASLPVPAQSQSQNAPTTTTTPTTKLNILVRSIMVFNLYFDDRLLGRHHLPTLIANDMQRNAVPQHIVTYSQYGMQFLNRLCKPVYDTLKLYTLNRNRQRLYLDAMFRDWNMLQKDASTVDMCFQKEFQLDAKTTLPYVSHYTMLTAVGLMDHHIALGVELELFHGPYHLMTAFWYRDFLLSAKLNVATSIMNHLKERRAMEATIAMEDAAAGKAEAKATAATLEAESVVSKNRGKKGADGGGKGKKKGKKKRGNAGANKKSNDANKVQDSKLSLPRDDDTIVSPEDREDKIDALFLSAERTLCRGVVRYLAALYQADVIQMPQYKFTTHELCFKKRFESIQQIVQPPNLSYDDFLKGTDFSSVSSRTLISSSTECFNVCKSLFQSIRSVCDQAQVPMDDDYRCISNTDIKRLTKVCIGNSLFLLKISQATEKGESVSSSALEVNYDFTSNKQFCTIRHEKRLPRKRNNE